jgi:hypothetical protein
MDAEGVARQADADKACRAVDAQPARTARLGREQATAPTAISKLR